MAHSYDKTDTDSVGYKYARAFKNLGLEEVGDTARYCISKNLTDWHGLNDGRYRMPETTWQFH